MVARIVLRACKACNFITEDEVCPRCGSPTTKEWQGMVAIADWEKSEIAHKMGIKTNGRFALKVR
ncbi:MAG: DNA-directed RNA polymerase subunit E [Candidatus Methanomethylophilus sp.]|nr:DNA-directed RNA polymerase subunit E [Methanomethylophilus sp.]MDD3233171.1 DNA-directed RNA polymerase subunit E [Methanomethylophilus sp.]